MIIYNFKINKNIYRDISNEAIRHRVSIHKEINYRLNVTLNKNYKYGSNEMLMHVALQTLEEDGYNEFKRFDYPIYKYEVNTINKLKKCIGNETELNKEMCVRLAYTLHDPFYENYINEK